MTLAPSTLTLALRIKKAYPDATSPASEIAHNILRGNTEDEERNVTWEGSFSYVADIYDGPADYFTRWGVTPAGVYFVDDGDEDTRDPATVYWSREDAETAAFELAVSQNEAEAGEDAEDTKRRLLKRAVGDVDPEGLWACYWDTVGDDSRPGSRYETREQAAADVELRNIELREANPGGRLLCGYEVRHFEDGEWVRDEEY